MDCYKCIHTDVCADKFDVEECGCKCEEYAEEAKIPFPFQYLEQYLCGELIWDAAIDNTMNEVYRLIEEYVETHDLKTNL